MNINIYLYIFENFDLNELNYLYITYELIGFDRIWIVNLGLVRYGYVISVV